MSNRRTEIIIQEINYWKEHKLLPEVYCNFLLALYTKGESESKITDSKEKRSAGLVSMLQFISQFSLFLLSVIIINMQGINSFFQFLFLLFSFIGIFWLFKILNKKRDIYFHFATGILLVHMFLITVFLGNQYTPYQWVIHIIMICNFIYWFIIGRKYKITYISIISTLLTILTITYMFF